jgi:hypothetical protein
VKVQIVLYFSSLFMEYTISGLSYFDSDLSQIFMQLMRS